MFERFLFKKIEVWLVGLIVLLFTILIGTWGFTVLKYQVFPYTILLRLDQFIEGHEQDKRSLLKRLKSEFAFDPLEFEALRKTELVSDDSLRSVEPGNFLNGIIAENMKFFSITEELRYFVVFGSFVFPQQEINIGSVLIDSRETTLSLCSRYAPPSPGNSSRSTSL